MLYYYPLLYHLPGNVLLGPALRNDFKGNTAEIIRKNKHWLASKLWYTVSFKITT